MVSSCCVKGCSEKFVKGGGISYFRISSKPELQRNAWISALQRNGWTPKPHHRICSRHFLTGTWNADPSHIDYIPTINMYKDGNDNAESNTFPQDHSEEKKPSLLANGAQHHTITSAENNLSHIANNRVPIMGVSSSQFSQAKSKKQPAGVGTKRKNANPSDGLWETPIKLKSSHFCEHKDIHRNCCRVIRELAEENNILKAQVNFLFLEVQKLKAQNPDPPLNGSNQLTADEIEIVSNSAASNDEEPGYLSEEARDYDAVP